MPSPDYDAIAPSYNERYRSRLLEGVAARLHDLAQRVRAQQAVEVGCGTGRWLNELAVIIPQMVGLDLSMGMLRKAKESSESSQLVCGQAVELPFSTQAFDLVFCVNALHHFPDPASFIRDASRLLRSGGALAVIGMDPHRGRDSWYLYHYFQGAYETDLHRFPSKDQILNWMNSAGFRQVEWGVAEHIFNPLKGEAVLADPFLKKNGTSQLILLTDHDYAQGVGRIRNDLREAQSRSEEIVFPVDIELIFITGIRV